MKLLSVLANIVALVNTQHHTDSLGSDFISLNKTEEDRHPNIIDWNHVITKDS